MKHRSNKNIYLAVKVKCKVNNVTQTIVILHRWFVLRNVYILKNHTACSEKITVNDCFHQSGDEDETEHVSLFVA